MAYQKQTGAQRADQRRKIQNIKRKAKKARNKTKRPIKAAAVRTAKLDRALKTSVSLLKRRTEGIAMALSDRDRHARDAYLEVLKARAAALLREQARVDYEDMAQAYVDTGEDDFTEFNYSGH